MDTSSSFIEKDTASISDFNSDELSKKRIYASQKTYSYLNNTKYYGAKPRTLERHLSNLFKEFSLDNNLTNLINNIGTLNIPPAQDYPNLVEIEMVSDLLRKSLNIEFEAEAPKPTLHDYGTEGISLNYREAEKLHDRLMELKQKYGLTG